MIARFVVDLYFPMTMRENAATLRLAVLISGGGTTLKNFIDQIAAGKLDAQIKIVISSSPAAGGLRFAADAQIPFIVLDRKDFESTEAFSRALFARCRAAAVDLVLLGGFLKLISVPPDFEGRVMNIHPALIPNFCGQGFYGRKVHAAVLAAGAKESGCTVHFVDNQYDHGPIILQRSVPVLPDDTPESLAHRVFEVECETYPEAVRRFAAGR